MDKSPTQISVGETGQGKAEEEAQNSLPAKTNPTVAGYDLNLSFEPDYDLEMEPDRKSSPAAENKQDNSKKPEREESSDSSSSSSDEESEDDGDRRKKHRKHKKNKHKKAKKSRKIKA